MARETKKVPHYHQVGHRFDHEVEYWHNRLDEVRRNFQWTDAGWTDAGWVGFRVRSADRCWLGRFQNQVGVVVDNKNSDVILKIKLPAEPSSTEQDVEVYARIPEDCLVDATPQERIRHVEGELHRLKDGLLSLQDLLDLDLTDTDYDYIKRWYVTHVFSFLVTSARIYLVHLACHIVCTVSQEENIRVRAQQHIVLF